MLHPGLPKSCGKHMLIRHLKRGNLYMHLKENDMHTQKEAHTIHTYIYKHTYAPNMHKHLSPRTCTNHHGRALLLK